MTEVSKALPLIFRYTLQRGLSATAELFVLHVLYVAPFRTKGDSKATGLER